MVYLQRQSTITKKIGAQIAACTFSQDALPMCQLKITDKDDTRLPDDEKFKQNKPGAPEDR